MTGPVGDLVPLEESRAVMSRAVFGDDPEAAVDRADRLVDKLNKMIATRRSDFVVTISGRKYPRVDWWTAMGQVLGLSPDVAWVHRVDDSFGGVETYEARVEVRNRNGDVISSGQAICSRKEHNWEESDSFALYSMAQTRATGKAFRLPLSFAAVRAGFQPTPAEEVDDGVILPKDRNALIRAFHAEWDTTAREIPGADDQDTNRELKRNLVEFVSGGRVSSVADLTDDEIRKGLGSLMRKRSEVQAWLANLKVEAGAPEATAPSLGLPDDIVEGTKALGMDESQMRGLMRRYTREGDFDHRGCLTYLSTLADLVADGIDISAALHGLTEELTADQAPEAEEEEEPRGTAEEEQTEVKKSAETLGLAI